MNNIDPYYRQTESNKLGTEESRGRESRLPCRHHGRHVRALACRIFPGQLLHSSSNFPYSVSIRNINRVKHVATGPFEVALLHGHQPEYYSGLVVPSDDSRAQSPVETEGGLSSTSRTKSPLHPCATSCWLASSSSSRRAFRGKPNLARGCLADHLN